MPGREAGTRTSIAEELDERNESQSARAYLDEVDRLVSLGFLAGGIAHEINNALTSMRLSVGRLVSFELSRRPMSDESRHRVELLQDVREGVSRIERIVRELKTFSHVESGPVRVIDVQAELDNATSLVGHEIRHRAQLVCDYQAVPPVRARAASLRQVFVNLLLNALHAIPEGEAHIQEIRIATRTDDKGRVVIEIEDTGRGIPTEVARRLFEPFFTTTPMHGLGLGLAISRDVVAALGGEISIDSVEGKGTTVRVVIPSTQDVVERATESAAEPATTSTTVRRRILIIDDDRPVAAAIAFELHAHDVVVAESGREALEILRREKNYDVILCDLMMPEVTGMDVYESLRMTAPSLLERLVLMTGGAFTPQARRFVAEVNAPLIEKPFETGQLLAVVETLLRQHQPADIIHS
jgi:two-component system, cell cycle sensor histidine kinase and response regulator CckA